MYFDRIHISTLLHVFFKSGFFVSKITVYEKTPLTPINGANDGSFSISTAMPFVMRRIETQRTR